MMKRILAYCVGEVIFALLIGATCAVFAQDPDHLDSAFRINGEVYLCIGKESNPSTPLRGVYRLNDPAGSSGHTVPCEVINGADAKEFLGLAVDHERKIYTLSDPTESPIGDDFRWKRQVLDDGVSATLSDWGYHEYIHTDHRTQYKKSDGIKYTGSEPVYRTGPAGRGVRNAWGGTWGGFTSAGPGDSTSAPPDPEAYMPRFRKANGTEIPALTLRPYADKEWYAIPNNAWYSSWKTGTAYNYNNYGFSSFYYNFADCAEGTEKNWKLVTWDENANNVPYYETVAEKSFGKTYELTVRRYCLAGCLDGCGGASGDGSVTPEEYVSDVAFLPVKDNEPRVYFYSRVAGTSNYEITKTGAGSGGVKVLGDPGALDTKWVGVSLGGADGDYLYCLGNSTIQGSEWKNDASIDITAVTVSNQWFEKGGIVFAYDNVNKAIYRWDCDEGQDQSSPLRRVYSGRSVAGLLNNLGVGADTVLDDIKADGFGKVFVGLSYPDPNENFDADFLHAFADTFSCTAGCLDENDFQKGELYFDCSFRKTVVEIGAHGEPPFEIGSKTYAIKRYKQDITVSPEGWAEISAFAKPSTGLRDVIASWGTETGAELGDYVLDNAALTGVDPGRCRLAVINVPTPPEVHSLGGKKSYLDIIGAYKERIPNYDPGNRTTRQNDPGHPRESYTALDANTLYFFMVENYPVPTGAQNPNVEPDYDKDGRWGGFVSTIKDPKPSTDGGTVRYYWRTWRLDETKDDNGTVTSASLVPVGQVQEGSFFHWFYATEPGKFLVTCRVNYDWWDYTEIAYGTTYSGFKTSPGNADKNGTWAVPAIGGGALTSQTSSERFDEIEGIQAFESLSLIGGAKNTLFGSDNGADYFAVQEVVVTGDPPPLPSPGLARVQRCNRVELGDAEYYDPVSGLDHWYPKQNESDYSFHGLREGNSYHWRIDLASQAVLWQDLETDQDAYNTIAGLLVDPAEDNPYYVPNFEQNFALKNLRWSSRTEDTSVICRLEYPVPDANGNVETETLTWDAANATVVSGANGKFAYFTTPATLPVSDPLECKLVIEMHKMLLYDVIVYDTDNPNIALGKVSGLPKQYKLEGSATLLIVDMTPPSIDFSVTSPNQMYLHTGELLETWDDDGGHYTGINFAVKDNNPWEAVANLSPHEDYDPGNIDSNKEISPVASASVNYLPVFDMDSRSVVLQYDIASMPTTQDRKVIATSLDGPSYGIPNHDGLTLDDASVGGGKVNKDWHAVLEFTAPFDKLWYNTVSTVREPLFIPKFYANNTPGYQPYEFRVIATDSSGNCMGLKTINVCIHVKDNIPPEVFGCVDEKKGPSRAFFPSSGISGNDVDVYAGAFFANTTLDNAFQSLGDWIPNPPDNGEITDDTGSIANTTFSARWQESEDIMPLPELMTDPQAIGLAPNIVIEDNVGVEFTVRVNDNAGTGNATMTYKYFDITGSVREGKVVATFSNPGIGGGVASGSRRVRAIFREGTNATFPLAIPITIKAKDDARAWDHYDESGGDNGGEITADDSWRWKSEKFIQGDLEPNLRTFKTTLPVYGTNLHIRTIERGLRRSDP